MKAVHRLNRLMLVCVLLTATILVTAPYTADAASCYTVKSGNWTDTSVWTNCDSKYPGQAGNDYATVKSGHTVTLNADAGPIYALQIESGATFQGGSNTLSFSAKRDTPGIINNGTFNANTGAISFIGTIGSTSHTVSGSSSTTFYNVTSGGNGANCYVDFGSNSTVNGTFQINQYGGVITNAPTYATGSTLLYNATSSYLRSTEWSATSGKGYPYNVRISNNTSFDLSGNGSADRQIAGSLTIDSGSTLTMNAMGNKLTVLGDLYNAGTLTLSSASGGDLHVKGNWANTGTFNHSSRAVEFNGSAAQSINGSTTTFAYLTINNSAGISLGASHTVNNQLTLTSGRLTLGSYNLTLGSSATIGGSPGASNMVVATGSGFLKKTSGGTLSSFTFPVGDAGGTGNYTPVTLDCGSTIDNGKYAQVRLVASKHDKMGSIDHITRYWIMESDDTAVSCTGVFKYVDGDVAGTEANITPVKYNGSVWSQLSSPAIDTTANTLTGGFTSFSDFSGGNWGTLAVDLAAFTADATPAGVTLAWETVSETDNAGFNVYRSPGSDDFSRPAGSWLKLNAALIPAAAPGASGGHAYTWVDATAAANTAYVYRLEAVALDGTAVILDTLGVTYRPAQRRWLPFLARGR